MKWIKKFRKINLLTLFLVFCTAYMGFNATFNVMKCVDYQIKLGQLHKLQNGALAKNNQLSSEIDSYTSSKKYEEYGRNYMGYAGRNEIKIVLVEKNNLQLAKNNGHKLLMAY